MVKSEQIKQITTLLNEVLDLVAKKGDDYSDGEDRLSAFKKAANIIGTSPWMIVMVNISIKQVRLMELLTSSKTPQNESIQDTIKDMIGYLSLLYLILYGKDR